MYISSVFRVTNKPLKGWVYLLYCKIIECVLNIQCYYNKINKSINQSISITTMGDYLNGKQGQRDWLIYLDPCLRVRTMVYG